MGEVEPIIMETLSVEVTYQLPAARPNAAAAAAVGCAVRSSELLMTQHISSWKAARLKFKIFIADYVKFTSSRFMGLRKYSPTSPLSHGGNEFVQSPWILQQIKCGGTEAEV